MEDKETFYALDINCSAKIIHIIGKLYPPRRFLYSLKKKERMYEVIYLKIIIHTSSIKRFI